MFRLTTPDETRTFHTYTRALEWHEKVFFERAWADDFYVKWEQVEVEGELPEDTGWLERRLGRE